MQLTRSLLHTLLACASISFFSGSVLAYEPPQNPRTKFNFNAGWRVYVGDVADAEAVFFNDAGWKPITTPHAWNEDDAFRKNIYELPTGIAWYHNRFKLPRGSTSKKIFLQFEDSRHDGEFYLNGEWIGRSENGVMAFSFDITNKVKLAPQENILAAHIDNSWSYREKATDTSFQWSERNFYVNYGGINKNVYLRVADRLHQTLPLYSNLGTTGVYSHARDFGIARKRAVVTAESQVLNEYPQPRRVHSHVVIEDANPRRGFASCLDNEL
jgi:beta-galactosidase